MNMKRGPLRVEHNSFPREFQRTDGRPDQQLQKYYPGGIPPPLVLTSEYWWVESNYRYLIQYY
jgi:hypothetical protein